MGFIKLGVQWAERDNHSPWNSWSYVSFIPYFHLLVFGILVTLVAWFSFRFFPSCPFCFPKCKQRLHKIFIFLYWSLNIWIWGAIFGRVLQAILLSFICPLCQKWINFWNQYLSVFWLLSQFQNVTKSLNRTVSALVKSDMYRLEVNDCIQEIRAHLWFV